MFDAEDLLPEGAFLLVAAGAKRLFVWLGSEFAEAEGVSGDGDGDDDDERSTAADIARKIAEEARAAVSRADAPGAAALSCFDVTRPALLSRSRIDAASCGTDWKSICSSAGCCRRHRRVGNQRGGRRERVNGLLGHLRGLMTVTPRRCLLAVTRKVSMRFPLLSTLTSFSAAGAGDAAGGGWPAALPCLQRRRQQQQHRRLRRPRATAYKHDGPSWSRRCCLGQHASPIG